MNFYRLWLIAELHPDKTEEELDNMLKQIVRITAYTHLGTNKIPDTAYDHSNFTIESDGDSLHIREISCKLGGEWHFEYDYIRNLCKDYKCYGEKIYIPQNEKYGFSQEELKTISDDEISSYCDRFFDDYIFAYNQVIFGACDTSADVDIYYPDGECIHFTKTFGDIKKKCDASNDNRHSRFMNYLRHDELEEHVKETAFKFIVNNDINQV